MQAISMLRGIWSFIFETRSHELELLDEYILTCWGAQDENSLALLQSIENLSKYFTLDQSVGLTDPSVKPQC